MGTIFLLGLWLPTLFWLFDGGWFRPRPYLTDPFPTLSENFPRRFDAHFERVFRFQEELIRWRAEAMVSLLGVSPRSTVHLGKDGWLFLNDGGLVDKHVTAEPLTGERLQRWTETVSGLKAHLESKGIRFLMVVVPDKASIHPEKLGRHHRIPDRERPLDRFLLHLRVKTGVEILDLRPVLLSTKPVGPIYKSKDTHWTPTGAFFGCQEIARTLIRWYPAVQPMELSEMESYPYFELMPDLQKLLLLRIELRPDRIFLRPKNGFRAKLRNSGRYVDQPMPFPGAYPHIFETGQEELPTAVIFRDSFSTDLMPFLAEHFERSVFIWNHYHYRRVVDTDVIDRERPDLFLWQITERRIRGGGPTLRVSAR